MALNIKSETVTVNYEEYAGDTLEMRFTWKDSLGNPFDLTGHTAALKIKVATTDPTPLLTLTNGAGITLGSATDNLVAVITDAQTTTLGKGKYIYALELTDPSGKVNTLIVGSLVLIQSAI